MNLFTISNEAIEELCIRVAELVTKNLTKEIPSKTEDLITYKEAHKLLNVSSGTLYNWTKQGKLKSYHLGRRTYYRKSEILEQVLSKKTTWRVERHVR